MSRTTLSISAAALVAAAFLGANDAKAVRLDPEAGGQALIYPYYTVRSRGTDPFNTYLSIVNTSADGKALRVRFREGRQGLETLGFNLFLSPNDTWTGALVPSADGGTQLVTTDRSCATYAAPFDASGMNREPLSAASFAADGPDRTREGYVEVLEMGTVKGATLAAITQDAGGTPHDCGFVQSRLVDRAGIAAPSGGLQGTLTLINVASGMDMTVNAEALADLATTPYYRDPLDGYPDFSASEIAPVSSIQTGTHVYRLLWSNGVDAVSSVLMRDAVINEYILDSATTSLSDWVMAFPTRRLLVSASGTTAARAPFAASAAPSKPGCETFSNTGFNRETQGPVAGGSDYPEHPPEPPPPAVCYASTVFAVGNGQTVAPGLFGSVNTITSAPLVTYVFQNGWSLLQFTGAGASQGLVSLPGSSRVDLRTGSVTTGAVRVQGLPVTGFLARSFYNGLLTCSGGTCQGSYGSAFPHRSTRAVSLVP